MRAGLWDTAHDAAARFPENDPRRAASLDALGAAGGDDAEIRRLWGDALRAWDAAAAWVETMGVVEGARSSTFHLRLADKHRGAYPEIVRARHRRTLAAGRAGTAANLAALDGDDDGLRQALVARREAFGPRESGAAAIAAHLGETVEGRVLDRFTERPPERDDDERRLYAAALLAPVLRRQA